MGIAAPREKKPLNGRAPKPAKSKPVKLLATLDPRARLIPVELIGADPDQPRKEFDPESLERLGVSLKEHGQLQPIRVRWVAEIDQYVIIAGERRWRAAMLAGIPSLAAIVEDRPLSPEERLTLQMIENCCREDLSALEKARAMRALIDRRGWSQLRLSEELGVSQQSVSVSLAILNLPPPVLRLVVTEKLSARIAVEIDRLEDKALVCRLAEDALRYNWTREQARTAARSRGAPLAEDEMAARQPASAPVGEGLSPNSLVHYPGSERENSETDPEDEEEAAEEETPIAIHRSATIPAPAPAPAPAPGEGRDVPASVPKNVPPASVPAKPERREQLVFGFVSEQGFEIVIERKRPWTGNEILAAVWELKVKLERQYLHGEGGGK